jgi:3-oxoacyl-[acyl-carrier protein] reductase
MSKEIKTTLVTGATGGIGLAVSHRLALAGHRLVLSARDPEKLDRLVQELPVTKGFGHQWIACDMADEASVQLFGQKLDRSKLVLNGVVLMPPQPHATNDCLPDNAVWRSLFQSSFIGPLDVLKRAIHTMSPDPAKGRRSKIVIISGISSAQVLGHYATSNVIRTAWLAEAKTLAFAFGERGIHVNTLSLGGTLSDWYRARIEKRAEGAGMTFEERITEETANVPLRKYGTPDEVAGAVEGLLSAFSDHMTGLNILHDGGFTRAY